MKFHLGYANNRYGQWCNKTAFVTFGQTLEVLIEESWLKYVPAKHFWGPHCGARNLTCCLIFSTKTKDRTYFFLASRDWTLKPFLTCFKRFVLLKTYWTWRCFSTLNPGLQKLNSLRPGPWKEFNFSLTFFRNSKQRQFSRRRWDFHALERYIFSIKQQDGGWDSPHVQVSLHPWPLRATTWRKWCRWPVTWRIWRLKQKRRRRLRRWRRLTCTWDVLEIFLHGIFYVWTLVEHKLNHLLTLKSTFVANMSPS